MACLVAVTCGCVRRCTCTMYGNVTVTVWQEWIFSVEGLKPHGWYLTFLQFGFYLIFGCIESLFQSDRQRKCVRWSTCVLVMPDFTLFDSRIPLKSYLLLAGLTVSTMGLSNASLGHLNYPTQVYVQIAC